jgi:DNA-directed RNA polymerase specialized sigma24 family protein
MVFARVFEQGPRGRRPEDPQSDAGVRGWLYRAVRNQAIDMVRAGRRDVELTEDMSQCAAGGCRPDDDLLAAEHERARAELAREIASARCELQQDIARTIATSLRADARSEFELTVQDLFALRDEILTVDAIVRRQRGEVTTRTRNAIYQRLSRARRRLADAVETIAASAACSPRHADILRAVVRSLGRQD